MRFAQLSWLARGYIFAVWAAALAVIAWQAASGSPAWSWTPFALLTAAATTAHSFPVATPGKQAFHVSLPFFVAAILLLEPLQLTVLMLIVNGAEWGRRHRTRSWYTQLFNIANYVLVGAACQAVAGLLVPRAATAPLRLDDVAILGAGAAIVATYLVVNRTLVGLAIWLANGIPPSRATVLDPEAIGTEALLLALGLPLALLTQIGPIALVLGAAPLLLIHRALDLPNVRAQRRQDALTQLFTQTYLNEVCGREITRAQRFERPLSVLVIDIDNLGRVNGDFGQQAGDAVIRGVAQLIGRVTRPYDVAARVAGGQFAVLLPETGLDGAELVAERLRAAVAAHRFEVLSSLDPISSTVTIGVAAMRGDETPEQLFRAAEAAMAAAKRDGRNRVAAASAEDVPVAAPAAPPVAPPQAAGAPPAPARPAPPATSAWPPAWLGSPESVARAFALLVAIAGAGLIAWAAPSVSSLDPVVLLLMAALIMLAETRPLDLPERSSYSLATVPIIAAAILLGPAGAVVVAPISALIRAVLRRIRWYRAASNAGTYVLAAAAAAAIFELSGVPVAPEQLPRLLPVAAGAGLAYFAHTIVPAIGIGTETRQSPLAIWASQYRWLWWQYVVLAVMALLLALAYDAFGLIGAAAFVVPPLMMRYVAKQYLDRTYAHVRQLRGLNEQLQAEIVQRKAAEEENSRLAGEAARAAALEELSRLKSEFISIASHELRTPLATVLGFSELLLEEIGPDDPRQQYVAVINQDAVQLSSLVDNLLDISRIETGRLTLEKRPVDLGQVVPPLITTLSTSSPRHHLVADLGPETRWVEADPGKLNQILVNLIGNAIKYSPEGGEVVVRSRSTPDGRVEVSVADQGVGIPEAHLQRIFERFHRVDSSETREIPGTGLGLYIVRHLVELHGGSVVAESTPGRGSTFRFTLAAARPAAGPMGAAAAGAEVAP